MSEVLDLAAVAALVGDPARANILCALLDGRALTAGELAYAARVSYDHVAGRLGVALADALQEHGHIVLSDEGGEVTHSGKTFLGELGIDIDAVSRQRRAFCRTCVDWSERRLHIAGAVGAALAQRLLERRWIERVRDGRALVVTPAGRRGLDQSFGLTLHHESRRIAPAAVTAAVGRA